MKQPQYPIYYPVTQSMANLLSEESRARLEKYSNFQALLNSFAKVQDDLGSKLSRYARNTNIETFDLNTLDLLYSIDKSIDVSSIVVPGISCTKTDKSTIEEWAYDSIRDNMHLSPSSKSDLQGYSTPYISKEYNISQDILRDNRIAINCTTYNNSFDDVDIDTDPFYEKSLNTLSDQAYIFYNCEDKYFVPYIKMFIKNSGPILFNNDPNTPLDILSITLYGLDDNFMPQEETIGFLYNSTKRSSKKWRLISAYTINLPDNVRQYAIENNGTIQISILNTNGIYTQNVIKSSSDNGSFPDQYIEDPLYRYYDQENKEYVPLFYKFRAWSGFGFIAEKYILDRYDINRYILVDKLYITANLSTKIISAIPSEYSEKFYIIDNSGRFLWFDRRQQYSSMSKFINLRTQDPIVNIDYFIEYSEDNSLDTVILKGNYNRLRPSQTITKYRFIQIDKFGNRDKILYEPSISNEYNDNWITYDNSYWTDYKPKDTLGFLSPIVKSEYRLETGILLEVMVDSGYIYTDYIVLDVQLITANYLLETAIYTSLNFVTRNICIDENIHGNLMLLYDDLWHQYYSKINFISNTYFETDSKKLFLTNTILRTDTEINVTIHNVYNELDQLAALIGIERLEGESNEILLKRIDYIKKNPISSSRNGTINALAAYTNNYNVLCGLNGAPNLDISYSYPKINLNSKVLDENTSASYTVQKLISTYPSYLFGEYNVYTFYHLSNITPQSTYYILDYSNRVYVNNLRIFENYNHFIIDHTAVEYNKTIEEINIKNFTKVNTKEELNTVPKSYYYNLKYNNLFRMMTAEVFTSEPLSYYDTVSVIALNHPIVPINIFNVVSSYNILATPLQITNVKQVTIKDLIKKSETIYPTKWS